MRTRASDIKTAADRHAKPKGQLLWFGVQSAVSKMLT